MEGTLFSSYYHNDNKDLGAQSNYRILYMYNVLITGKVLLYEDVQEIFETSLTTWKRDIKAIKQSLQSFYDDQVKVIKIQKKKAYILYLPSTPLRLYIG